MKDFKDLGLSPAMVQVLANLGFEKPTPIQEKAIPILLSPDPTDFIGLAQTGTGKTAAFGLPLIERINAKESQIQALIMAPTRELCLQISQQLTQFAKGLPISIVEVYGGASISQQIKALKRPTQIVVATPGRLMDLINRKAINIDSIEYVVLDEADEMLNMGFKEAIDEILAYTPDNRVTWLFSATMPTAIRKIVSKYMKSPAEISIDRGDKVNKDIDHQYVVTKSNNKLGALRRFMDLHTEMRGVMFCRTKRETQEITDELNKVGYGVEALHGDLSQAQREQVMRRFKSRSMQLLVATDVAARGIDVDNLTHVIHHKLPDQTESYTHRSGRTARAGKKGISLAFINPREERRIRELEKAINIKFTRITVPTAGELKNSRMTNWASLIINTKVDDQADLILEELSEQFDHLTKNDILRRLITTQLDHLEGSDEDFNEVEGRKISKDEHRYFINLGLIDGITEGDLMHFMADISGINKKNFTDVSVQKNCAFFNLPIKYSQGFSDKFSGIEMKGRTIRVNRDDQKQEKRRPDFKGKSYSRSNRFGGNKKGRSPKRRSRR